MFFRQSHKNFMKLFTSFAGMNTDMIQRTLSKMPRWYLFRFLNFIHHACIHDQRIGFSSERLEFFQRVLMCCPRALLTRFLLSIDEQCVVNLLELCDVLWTMFFVGLINLGRDSDVDILLSYLMNNAYDVNFGVGLLMLLEREAKNQDRCLPRKLRQKIFDFLCQHWDFLGYIVQVQYGQEETTTIDDLVSKMNHWMSVFSEEHGLNFNPRFTVELHRFTRN